MPLITRSLHAVTHVAAVTVAEAGEGAEGLHGFLGFPFLAGAEEGAVNSWGFRFGLGGTEGVAEAS